MHLGSGGLNTGDHHYGSRRQVLLVLTLIFLDSLSFGLVLPVIPFAMLALGAADPVVTLHLVFFGLGAIIAGPVVGRLSDSYGYLTTFKWGLLLGAFFYLGLSVADTWAIFLLFRGLTGAASAKEAPISAYLVTLVEEQTTPSIMAWLGTVRIAGMFLGAAGGGLAAAAAGGMEGVRMIFVVSAAIAFATLVMSHFFLQSTGAAASQTAGSGKPSQSGRRARWADFRKPLFFSVTAGIAVGVIFSVSVLYMYRSFGWGPGLAGGALGVITLIIGSSRILLVKRLVPAIGVEMSVLLSKLILAGGMLLIATAEASPMFLIGWMTCGLSLGLLPTLLPIWFERVATTGNKAFAFGLSSSSFMIGQVASALFSGYLFERISPGAPFGLAAAILAAVAVAALIWRGRVDFLRKDCTSADPQRRE